MGKFDLKKAKAFLDAIKTPEQAVQLAGKERAQYLKALEMVQGPVEKRIAEHGMAEPWYHGSKADIKELIPNQKNTGTGAQGGFTSFTSSPHVASRFARESHAGLPYEVAQELGVFEDKLSKPETINSLREIYGPESGGYSKINTRAYIRNENNNIRNLEKELESISRLEEPKRYTELLNKIDKEYEQHAKKLIDKLQGEQVYPVRIRSKDLPIINYEGSFDPTIVNQEITKGRAKDKGGIRFNKMEEQYPSGDFQLGPDDLLDLQIASKGQKETFKNIPDTIMISDPSRVRSVNAAYDLRFKDSSLLMAGMAPAMPSVDDTAKVANPVEAIKNTWNAYRDAKNFVLDKAADQMDVRPNAQTPSSRDFIRGALDFVDPADALSGGAGLAAGALDALVPETKKPEQYASGGEVMNFKHFKKVSSHEDHSVLRHPDGHEIKVAHKALSPKMRQQLDKLPHYAEGGSVFDEPWSAEGMMRKWAPGSGPVGNNMVESNEPLSQISAADVVQQPVNLAPMPAEAAPEQQPMPSNIAMPGAQQPMQAPGPEMASKALPPTELESGMKQVAGAYEKLGQIESQAAKARAKAAAHQQAAVEERQKTFQLKAQAIEAERAALQRDILEGKIDPNRYINSQSTGGKVANVIGLLLGGMGSGLTGGPNMAADFLNKQIERDIDAQKMDLHKKQNLLSALDHQFGNLKDAENMARMFYADKYAAEMEQIAAKSNDPAAIERAKLEAGKLRMQFGPQMQEMARRQTLLHLYRQGQQQPGRPGAVQSEQMIEFLPEKLQDQAYKDLDKIRTIDKSSIEIANTIKRMQELQSNASRLGSPIQSRKMLQQEALKIQSLAKEIYGKTSDTEIEQLAKNANVGFMDSPQTVANLAASLQSMIKRNRVSSVLRSQPGLDLMPPEPITSARPRK